MHNPCQLYIVDFIENKIMRQAKSVSKVNVMKLSSEKNFALTEIKQLLSTAAGSQRRPVADAIDRPDRSGPGELDTRMVKLKSYFLYDYFIREEEYRR